MRYTEERYVGEVLGLLADYFRARGYWDSWLWDIAERAVEDLHQWALARQALSLFKLNHERDLDDWERRALNFAEFIMSLDGVVFLSGLLGGAGEGVEVISEEVVGSA